MCQYGRIKIFYKVKNKLARQRLQNKTGKEEGKEPKETGPQIGNVRMGSVKITCKKQAHLKTDYQ